MKALGDFFRELETEGYRRFLGGMPTNVKGTVGRTDIDRAGKEFESSYGSDDLSGRYIGAKQSGERTGGDTESDFALGGSEDTTDTSALSGTPSNTTQSKPALERLGFKKDENAERLAYAQLGVSAASTLVKGAEFIGERTAESQLLGQSLGAAGTVLTAANIAYKVSKGEYDKAAMDTGRAIISYYGATKAGATAAASATPTAGSYATSVLGKVAGPLAIVGAVSGVRESFGNTSTPYEKRTGAQQTVSAPGSGGVFLPGYLGKQAFGDSSDVAKAYDWLAKGEEKFAGEPLAEAFQGNFATATSKLLQAPQALAKDNFGETGTTLADISNPLGMAARQLGTCIVYGYLYGNCSIQARMAKIFCAKHMTEPKLVGYYSIGKKVINICEKFPVSRKWVKKILAEPFFKYMQYKIGGDVRLSMWARIFPVTFLALCKCYYYSGAKLFYPEGYKRCVQSTKDRLIPQES
jgi:hypothetical protein